LLLTPLYGDLPATEQDRAVTPASRRKVILSTNVAETSITVPGVTSVVDSGLARIASHSPWSGLPALAVARISRASAAQRAGRAGRLGPGRALRRRGCQPGIPARWVHRSGDAQRTRGAPECYPRSHRPLGRARSPRPAAFCAHRTGSRPASASRSAGWTSGELARRGNQDIG